jgi:AcrR family transcriptional regulator
MARRAYHHGNLRTVLLQSALALYAERQRFDFTMRELARVAGVTHNAPYRHFADRWALCDALAAEGFGLLRAALLDAGAAGAGDGDDPRARLARLGEAYVEFAIAHGDHFRLMFMRPLRDAAPELAKAARSSFAVLEEAVGDAHARGLLREGLPPKQVVASAWALVHGVASLVTGGQLSPSARTLKPHLQTATAIFESGAFIPRDRKTPRARA